MYDNIKRRHKNVNSKLLLDEIENLVLDGIDMTIPCWHRHDHLVVLSTYLDDILEEFAKNGKISQIKSVVDPIGMHGDVRTVSVQFKQSDCLNTTRLLYTFTV